MTRPKALLLDLDGTLYDAHVLRSRLARDLAIAALRSPWRTIQDVRIIQAYRHAQEEMRSSGESAAGQAEVAALACGISRQTVDECVSRWFDQAPLSHLASAASDGLIELLGYCQSNGILLAICSDYPAAKKLEALQIAHYFGAVVCAQDADVNRFKPSPRILNVALSRLGIKNSDALYAGDRPEVDGEAAAAAGVPYVNIVQKPGGTGITLVQLLASLRDA